MRKFYYYSLLRNEDARDFACEFLQKYFKYFRHGSFRHMKKKKATKRMCVGQENIPAEQIHDFFYFI